MEFVDTVDAGHGDAWMEWEWTAEEQKAWDETFFQDYTVRGLDAGYGKGGGGR